MSRSQAIVLLIFSCAGVAIFMTLDNGLSGANAQDPALGVAYIVSAWALFYTSARARAGIEPSFWPSATASCR